MQPRTATLLLALAVTPAYVFAIDNTCGMGSMTGGVTYAYVAPLRRGASLPEVTADTAVFAIKFGCTKHNLDDRFNAYIPAHRRAAFAKCGFFRSHWAGLHEERHFESLPESMADFLLYDAVQAHLEISGPVKAQVANFANAMGLNRFTGLNSEWRFYLDNSATIQTVCGHSMGLLLQSWKDTVHYLTNSFFANEALLTARIRTADVGWKDSLSEPGSTYDYPAHFRVSLTEGVVGAYAFRESKASLLRKHPREEQLHIAADGLTSSGKTLHVHRSLAKIEPLRFDDERDPAIERV